MAWYQQRSCRSIVDVYLAASLVVTFLVFHAGPPLLLPPGVSSQVPPSRHFKFVTMTSFHHLLQSLIRKTHVRPIEHPSLI